MTVALSGSLGGQPIVLGKILGCHTVILLCAPARATRLQGVK